MHRLILKNDTVVVGYDKYLLSTHRYFFSILRRISIHI